MNKHVFFTTVCTMLESVLISSKVNTIRVNFCYHTG